MTRTTQKKMVLQFLKEKRLDFIPVWWFVGERYSNSMGWVLLSHRVPARLTELYQDGLIERKKIKGKTGAYYYSYRYKANEFEENGQGKIF